MMMMMFPVSSKIINIIMMFQVSGITKDYVIAELDNIYGGDGATYTGKRALLEYNVGDVAMENLSNQTDKFGLVKVKIVFQRRWFYHGITVFLQSVLLLIVAYFTFFFRLGNFQVFSYFKLK